MKSKLSLKCPGCDHVSTIQIKKPGFLSPTITQYDCQGCQSGIFAKIENVVEIDNRDWSEVGGKPRDQGRDCRAQIRIISPSQKLKMMIQMKKTAQKVVRAPRSERSNIASENSLSPPDGQRKKGK